MKDLFGFKKDRFEKKETSVHFTSNTDEWSTPQDAFDSLNKEFQFTLDPCATKENAKCRKFYTKKQHGLLQDWSGESVFCNPPYSEISDWVKKCYNEGVQNGTTVVMLIPSRTDTKYWHNYIMKAKEIRFIRGRLKFGKAENNAPFPSAIIVF